MNGKLGTPTRPLLSPDQASQLLDEVIYERVLAMVDLDKLWQLEQELWFELDDIEGVDDDRIPDLSKAMVDRALVRLIDEPRRYMKIGAPDDLDDDCALCESMADDAQRDETARRKRAAALITPAGETS